MSALNPSRGELGGLPAAVGLVALSGVLAVFSPAFRSPANLANLFTQGAAVAVIAMGLVFVLMLGEIDLSAAATGGFCGALLAVLLRDVPAVLALPVALLAGTVVGLLLGTLVGRSRMPSVAVTLVAVLGLQGLTLVLLKDGATVPVDDELVVAIANRSLSPNASWLVWAVGISAYALLEVRRKRRGTHHRGHAEPPGLALSRVATSAVVSAVLVLALNRERSPHPEIVSLHGVPVVVPLIAAVVVGWSFVMRRTAFGRRLTLAAADRPRAEREGADLDRLRVAAFTICSTMAALGGIIAVSRSFSATPETGGLPLLLNAFAAAVLGATGLFGGPGRLQGALLGAAVVTVVGNGLSLLSVGQGLSYVALCAIVLTAVVAHPRPPVPVEPPRPAPAPGGRGSEHWGVR